MLPLISFYQSSSVSLRFLSTQSYYTSIIQRYSSSIRPPRPLFLPSAKKDLHNVIQTFNSLIDFRREQAQRTVFIHLGRSHSESELYKLCSRVGQISNMTLYSANKKECALLEFSNDQSVNKLLNITSHSTNENRLPCASRNLYFASQLTGSRLKHHSFGREVQQPDDSVLDTALADIRNVKGRKCFVWGKQCDQFFLEAFGSIFVDTVCLPFGSSITKFGKSRCDLDMLLTFEDFREKNIRILRMVFLNYERSDLQQIESDGKIQQLRFLTKRSYLNDRYPTA
ncbi:unnamed protein product [Adineta ricciae]|uniref:RRM domain-containing protein n=1 Tax=Adineta ricciae TaxID=249248 RepID=A0A814TB43_ADIRI|nr:unnamed protein product [Adineta ricciae]CAF1159270.1 unnamed protein product [Adineta ricciae]